jgi:polar amino acid transport system substrate-binding protein
MRVVAGTADAFVYDFPFNAVFTAMHPSSPIIFLDEPFTKEPIAWAIRKNDPDFLTWLNNFLNDIKQDGRFETMYEKWFENTEWFKYAR